MISKIAVTQPHAAYAAFVRHLQSRWVSTTRTTPGMDKLLEPLEMAIRTKFFPALFGREISDLERALFALPCRHAGLGIPNPCYSSAAFENSLQLTKTMVTKILRKEREFDPRELRREQNSTRDKQKIVVRALCKHNLQALSERVDLPKNLKRAIELASNLEHLGG